MAWTKPTAIPLRSQEDVDEEEQDEAEVGLINGQPKLEGLLRRASGPWYGLSMPGVLLIATNIFWALVATVAWRSSSSCHAERRMAHKTDFISHPGLHLPPRVTEFDDLLRYNYTSKSVYRQMNKSLPQYFGPPSPEIDAAWKNLLWPEYPAVSHKEMKWNKHLDFEEGDRLPATGQFYVALDVFHDLHCLNAVRKELDKDYYGDHHHHGSIGGHKTGSSSPVKAAAQRDHIDHCMNQIRQALQCRPDLSPAAMHIYPDKDGELFWLGNAKKHSCYNWDRLMDWAHERRRGRFGFWEDHDG